MGDKDADMSSDSDDGEPIDVSEQDLEAVAAAEDNLASNPLSYDAHISLIDQLQKTRLKERLKEVRRSMAERFALREDVWAAWLAEEHQSISSPEEVPAVVNLYELAVQDVFSPTLWAEYLLFVKEIVPGVAPSSATESGLQLFRDLAARALNGPGLHPQAGSQLHTILREYEMERLEVDESDAQLRRVRDAWHGQLAAPLKDRADTMSAYLEWEASLGEGRGLPEAPDKVKRAFQDAQAVLASRTAFEEKTDTSQRPVDAEMLAAFVNYLKLEQKAGLPGRTEYVFEKALAAFPVTVWLWQRYLKHLEEQRRSAAELNAVYRRAAKSCSWVGALWAGWMYSLERQGGQEVLHKDVFTRACAAALQGPEDAIQVVLARADALRRDDDAHGLRGVFQNAEKLLAERFPDWADRQLRLPAYWAECELSGPLDGGVDAARAVWESALRGNAGRCCEAWAEYAAMEVRQGCLEEARSVFRRGHSRSLEHGGQAALCCRWLRFEREHGSIGEQWAATLACSTVLEAAQSQQALQGLDPGMVEAIQALAAAAPRAGDAPQPAAEGGRKRSRGAAAAQDKRPAKKAACAAPAPSSAATGGSTTAPPAESASAPDATPPQRGGGAVPEAQPTTQDDRVAKAAPPPVYTDEHTVFVRGLPPSVTAAELRELFEGIGDYVESRLVMDAKTGASRGFGYVQYTCDDAVQRAVQQLNGHELQGKALFVAQSRPKGRGGRSGGRDSEGRGRGRGRSWSRSTARDATFPYRQRAAKPRHHLDVGGSSQPTGSTTAFLPRSVAGAKGDGAKTSDANTGRSNADFKRMMLGGD